MKLVYATLIVVLLGLQGIQATNAASSTNLNRQISLDGTIAYGGDVILNGANCDAPYVDYYPDNTNQDYYYVDVEAYCTVTTLCGAVSIFASIADTQTGGKTLNDAQCSASVAGCTARSHISCSDADPTLLHGTGNFFTCRVEGRFLYTDRGDWTTTCTSGPV